MFCDKWKNDSGATCHIGSNKSEFPFIDSKRCENITVANDETERSAGRGRCKVLLINSKGTGKIVTMDDVLYIPSFKDNLLLVKMSING